jgi:hypothetical protein
MRLIVRVALLTLLALGSSSALLADHLVADCPLSFVSATAPSSSFGLGPHGVFRNGSRIFVVRGGRLLTLNTTVSGEIQIVRPEDQLLTVGSENEGAALYHNGFLYIATESGLETFDLTAIGGPGTPGPTPRGRVAGVHYRRLAASGSLLAALFPMNDIPCSPVLNTLCRNSIDLYSLANPANPVRVAQISTLGNQFGFEDIAFANGGLLYTTGQRGTMALNVFNPAVPQVVGSGARVGRFLVTNGNDLLGIGHDTFIAMFLLTPGNASITTPFATYTPPSIVDRSNPLRFHPEAFIEGARLITLIDEVNPMNHPQPSLNGESARTIAIDVFDMSIVMFEGFDDRIYENVTVTFPDEVKHDPFAVGPYVYVVGELSGLQQWGACGLIAGAIDFDGLQTGGPCAFEMRGWVSSSTPIASVSLFLDGTLLGRDTELTKARPDIATATPARGWEVNVNFETIAAGTRTLRAVAVDTSGNQFQFATMAVNFPGSPNNCVRRARITKRK